MHAKVVASVVAAVAFGAGIGAPSPAAAAPAHPFTEGRCLTYGDEGGPTAEYCYETRGVVKQGETPSGNAQFHYVARTCYRIRIEDQLVGEGCSKHNSLLHERDGEERVYHANVKGTSRFEYLGTTYACTARITVTYANGQVRHEDVRFDCTPPLV